MSDITAKAQAIRCVIFDVDGVLTNGSVFLGPEKTEHKWFHIHDGLGIKLLLRAGFDVAVISSRQCDIVTQRMTNLGIKHIYQGKENKVPQYESLIQQLNYSDQQVAYVGDDLPDLPLIRRAGLGIAVANAVDIVKQHADLVTNIPGGQGAAREISETLLKAQQKLASLHKMYL